VTVRLVVSDVDGTLVTPDKALTARALAAVRALREVGVAFSVTSARPPLGLRMLVEPLDLTVPVVAFNGALIAAPDLSVLTATWLPNDAVGPILECFGRHGMAPWMFQDSAWYVADQNGPHVAHEATVTRIEPRTATDLAQRHDRVAKIVGVSDDPAVIATALADVTDRYGDLVAASCSQPYFVDVTSRHADKGTGLTRLCGDLGIALTDVFVLGDSQNDVAMFAVAGASAAMGNATPDVQRAATYVTASNDDEGFARAIEEFVLARV
jgi:Cof subfamily protein (haloacid dehalogenase superfamily)